MATKADPPASARHQPAKANGETSIVGAGWGWIGSKLPSASATIASVFLALLAPFVTFGESQIKSILSGWSDSCIIVLESKNLPHSQERLVTVYLAGKAPKAIPFSFNAFKTNSILSVKLLGSQEIPTGSIGSRLGLHPMANQTCPGDLCPGFTEVPLGERSRDILLSDLDASFTLRFHVFFSQPVTDSDFAVFVMYRPKLEEGVCRIEAAALPNLPLRLSPLWRIVFAAALLLFAGYAIVIIRQKTGGSG